MLYLLGENLRKIYSLNTEYQLTALAFSKCKQRRRWDSLSTRRYEVQCYEKIQNCDVNKTRTMAYLTNEGAAILRQKMEFERVYM